MQGIEQITTVHAEKLNSVGGPTDPLPIGAAFTGLILVNTFTGVQIRASCNARWRQKAWRKRQKGALLTAVLKMLATAGTGAARVDCVSSIIRIYRKPTWPTRRWSITFCQCHWWVSSARCYLVR